MSLLTTTTAMSISPLRSGSCSRWRPHQLPLVFLLQQSQHLSSAFPKRPPPSSARHFSQTSPCSSRTGATPVSVPAEVHLRLRPPKPRKVITRIQPNQILEVEGPLGGFVVFNLSFLEEWIDPGEIWGQAKEKKKANVGGCLVNRQNELGTSCIYGLRTGSEYSESAVEDS